jgi:hypothetical protein
MNTTFAGKEAVPTEPGAIVDNLKPEPVEFKELLDGPKMSKKSLSPGSLALVNVVFGTAALARALAKAQFTWEHRASHFPILANSHCLYLASVWMTEQATRNIDVQGN